MYECMTVLMRVDSQIDDKDLREKMRICSSYTPLHFGIDRGLSMMIYSENQVKSSKTWLPHELSIIVFNIVIEVFLATASGCLSESLSEDQ